MKPRFSLIALALLGLALSPVADAQTAPTPTPLAGLEAAQTALTQAALSLNAIPATETGSYGGHIRTALGDLNQARSDIKTALADAALNKNPGPPIPSSEPAGFTLPPLPQVSVTAPDTPLVRAVRSLNEGLAAVAADPVVTSSALGGLRQKILDDIGRAGIELSEGVEYHNHRRLAPAPAAPEESVLPSAIAGIALSFAIMLGGLHFFGVRRAVALPPR